MKRFLLVIGVGKKRIRRDLGRGGSIRRTREKRALEIGSLFGKRDRGWKHRGGLRDRTEKERGRGREKGTTYGSEGVFVRHAQWAWKRRA